MWTWLMETVRITLYRLNFKSSTLYRGAFLDRSDRVWIAAMAAVRLSFCRPGSIRRVGDARSSGSRPAVVAKSVPEMAARRRVPIAAGDRPLRTAL